VQLNCTLSLLSTTDSTSIITHLMCNESMFKYSIKCTPKHFKFGVIDPIQIVTKLQDTLDKYDVEQECNGGGAVSNYGYRSNHDLPGYHGTDL